MIKLSEKEREILLLLTKDFSSRYNAHSICSRAKMTHAGAYKALKKLEKNKLVIGERLGNAIFYKPILEDDYVIKILAIFLMEEARAKLRWLEEFRSLYPESKAVILFGSILKNSERANDIDLIVIADENQFNRINKIISEKNRMLPKKVHLIEQQPKDIMENLKKKNPALISAIRDGIILHGQEDLIRIIADVTK